MKKKKYRLKWRNIIAAVVLLLILIAGILAITLPLEKDGVITTDPVLLEESIAISINPDEMITNGTSDYNVYVDSENKIIFDETTNLLQTYGINFSNELNEESTVSIDINGETDYQLDNNLVIHTFMIDDVKLQYNIIVDPTLTITGIMVTPYILNNDEYIPLYDLVLYTNSYDEQTAIYNDISTKISSLTYIPLTPYEYIEEVSEMTTTTAINKNTCLSSEFSPTSTDIPNVAESQRTSTDVHYVDTSIIPAVEALFADLATQGVEVMMNSGYRSYATQESLYNNYVATDGVEQADTYSARPGCSEHQTGIAFDVSTIESDQGDLETLNNTPEAQIIYDTAPKYGFIVRYPEDKTHITQYSYESWHLRYVGEEVSNIIYTENITLDQYANNSAYYDAKYAS